MNPDIDGLLREWVYEPGTVQARLLEADDGRQVLQMRVDLGVLQLETNGRPDGARPHGCPTFLHYLRELCRKTEKGSRKFVMTEEHCQEADREFVQFYHRRICWLALRHYDRALHDADHTLAFMDFVANHAPSEEYHQAHEQYRGFVVFQRTQAAAAMQVEKENPEGAVDEIRRGLDRLRDFFAAFELENEMDEDGMVQHLRKVEANLRQEYNIGDTLEEQLSQAVADEDYEKAARLRDAIRRKRKT